MPIQVMRRDKIDGEISKELYSKDQCTGKIGCVVADTRGEPYDQHVDQKEGQNTDVAAPEPNDVVNEFAEDKPITIHVCKQLKQAGLIGVGKEIVGWCKKKFEI